MKKVITVCDICGSEIRSIRDGFLLHGRDAQLKAPDGSSLRRWDGGDREQVLNFKTDPSTHEAIFCWGCFVACSERPPAKR